MELRQLKKPEQLIGRKIKSIAIPEESYQDLVIRFSDDTFVAFSMNDVTPPYGYTSYLMGINDNSLNECDEELVTVGLISKETYRNALRKRDEEFEEYRKQQEQEELKRLEQIELEQLEELKKKYER